MRLSGLVAVMVLVSCQTYDFERVTPVFVGQTTDSVVIAARRLKPNMMLLVDRSLSMLRPTDPNDPDCPASCGTSVATTCPSTCPTRITELKSAMGAFLQTSATVARIGVTQFPTNTLCQPANEINVRLPAPTATDDGTDSALTTAATQANAFIQALTTQGGTPTGASLQFVGNSGDLSNEDHRDDFVLLLTDGVPNCNDANLNDVCSCSTGNTCSVAQETSCSCTTSNCVGSDRRTSLCAMGCLDKGGVVQSVKDLRAKNIRTIVVGFGADLVGGDGPDVLNAMAREGGFARGCGDGTDAECGGSPGSCNTTTKQCSTAFFQAANAVELAAALKKISEGLPPGGCSFSLSALPSEERYLAVLVDGQNLTRGPDTYSYDFGTNQVTFLGATCDKINRSTPQDPVSVQFRIVERF